MMEQVKKAADNRFKMHFVIWLVGPICSHILDNREEKQLILLIVVILVALDCCCYHSDAYNLSLFSESLKVSIQEWMSQQKTSKYWLQNKLSCTMTMTTFIKLLKYSLKSNSSYLACLFPSVCIIFMNKAVCQSPKKPWKGSPFHTVLKGNNRNNIYQLTENADKSCNTKLSRKNLFCSVEVCEKPVQVSLWSLLM